LVGTAGISISQMLHRVELLLQKYNRRQLSQPSGTVISMCAPAFCPTKQLLGSYRYIQMVFIERGILRVVERSAAVRSALTSGAYCMHMVLEVFPSISFPRVCNCCLNANARGSDHCFFEIRKDSNWLKKGRWALSCHKKVFVQSLKDLLLFLLSSLVGPSSPVGYWEISIQPPMLFYPVFPFPFHPARQHWGLANI
jgi:hypothetical protein